MNKRMFLLIEVDKKDEGISKPTKLDCRIWLGI